MRPILEQNPRPIRTRELVGCLRAKEETDPTSECWICTPSKVRVGDVGDAARRKTTLVEAGWLGCCCVAPPAVRAPTSRRNASSWGWGVDGGGVRALNPHGFGVAGASNANPSILFSSRFCPGPQYSIPNGPGPKSGTRHDPKKHGPGPALGTIDSA
jgi:hypothetical protein